PDRKPTTALPPPVVAPPPPGDGGPNPAPMPMPIEPEVEPLTVMPRDLPPPRLIVVTPIWSTRGKAAPGCSDFTRDGKRLVAAKEDSEKLDIYAVSDGRKEDPIDPSVGKIKAVAAAGAEHVIVNGDDNESAVW